MPATRTLVIARSVMGVTSSTSFAVLFVESGSVVPLGVTTPTVLVRLAVPAGVAARSVPVTVSVATEPGFNVTGRDMALPLPLVLEQEDPRPPVVEQVQVTPVIAAGTLSVTVAAVAVDGPALETTTV